MRTPLLKWRRWIAIVWVGFPLLFSANLYADSMAASAAPTVRPSSGEQGAAGTLRTIGAYPGERGLGHTVTLLADRKIFVYGHAPGAQSLDSVTLNPLGRSTELNTLNPMIWDPKHHAWRSISNPPECPYLHYLHTATALNNGKVLIAGGICDAPRGINNTIITPSHNALSLWDDKAQTWDAAPSLNEARIYHTATLLANGSVLLVGGESDLRTSDMVEPVLRSVEQFSNGKIAQLPPMLSARAKHTATKMADGSVLVAGGIGSDGKAITSVEIWDPATHNWSAGPLLHTARFRHSASLLSDGRLMVAGGIDQAGNAIASVEIFDPVTKQWSDADPLLVPLQRHASLTLNNGDVLVTGTGLDGEHPFARTMLWEKASAQWRPAGHLFSDRYQNALSYLLIPMSAKSDDVLVFDYRLVMQWSRSASGATAYAPYGNRIDYASTLMRDGRIMLAGGRNLLPGQRGGKFGLDWSEIYDPVTDHFSLTGRLTQPRDAPSAITLDDGKVLIASQWNGAPYTGRPDKYHFAEFWNPETGRWRVVEGLTFDDAKFVYLEKFAKLDGGKALFLFSVSPDNHELHYQAFIWDPQTGAVEKRQVGAHARIGASVAIAPSGRVLILGGAKEGFSGQAEVWDSRSGSIESLAVPPELQTDIVQTLALKNGSVVLVNKFNAQRSGASVFLWYPASGRWRKLPSLFTDNQWENSGRHMTELSDGTLVTDSFWLLPDAMAWSPVQRFPQDEARVTQLPSGRLIALSSSAPHVAYFDDKTKEWQLQANYYLQRKDKLKPALLELSDGRVMVSGSFDLVGWSKQTTTQIWNPETDTWGATGKLLGNYEKMLDAALLPSGQIIHFGIDRSGSLKCEIGHPSDHIWASCDASLPLKNPSAPYAVQTLQDGRIALVFSQAEAYAYSEQNKQWLPMQKDLSEIAKAAPGSSNKTFRLPDGCLISGPPFRIFNPATQKETLLNIPVTGIRSDSASMVVLTNGLVVVAGYQDGINEMGFGFFHRKATCAGFEEKEGDDVFMPGIVYTPPNLPAVAADTRPKTWPQQLVELLDKYKWFMLAVLGPFALYFPLRRMTDYGYTVTPVMETFKWVAAIWRNLIRILIAIILLIFLWNFASSSFYSHKNKSMPTSSRPCRFVGVWLSSQPGSEYRITLNADGSYRGVPVQDRSGTYQVFTGTWEVSGNDMVWRSNEGNRGMLDINPIHQTEDGRFTLTEGSGALTKFELLEKIDSKACTP